MDSAVQRNARTIARAQSFRDDEQNRRREELQRRIEETRKKLQNVSSIGSGSKYRVTRQVGNYILLTLIW